MARELNALERGGLKTSTLYHLAVTSRKRWFAGWWREQCDVMAYMLSITVLDSRWVCSGIFLIHLLSAQGLHPTAAASLWEDENIDFCHWRWVWGGGGGKALSGCCLSIAPGRWGGVGIWSMLLTVLVEHPGWKLLWWQLKLKASIRSSPKIPLRLVWQGWGK